MNHRLVRSLARALRHLDRAWDRLIADHQQLTTSTETVPPHPPGPVTPSPPAAVTADVDEPPLAERLIRFCKDENCPVCDWPETWVELNAFEPAPWPVAFGCSHCGWRVPGVDRTPDPASQGDDGNVRVLDAPAPAPTALPPRAPVVQVVHHWPGDRQAATSCCGARPDDLPADHDYSPNEAIVTCPGARL